ncbi:hypothetical protein DCC62_02895 [candidate division KSB1 bacterium]|nr:MAG: hypothetical protein DCC62_02895 [candidate division KSB1 bacterium]
MIRILSCVALAWFGFVSSLLSQSFTKITGGAVVTNGGASRSVNWVDYDNDGFLDLFVSNGLRAGQDNFLYHNDGLPDFSFTRITGAPIVSDRGKSDGSSWGDYDNDGDADVFVVNWYNDNNMFFENNGDGTFARITTGAFVNDAGLSETCSWGDFDNDGFLDLYVSNSGDVNQTGPRPNFLYRNNGDKTFAKITSGALVTDLFYSRGINWVDYDDDGDLDMFVANEENQANNLYQNQLHETGSATFNKITAGALVTDRASSWSGSWGDVDNDGDQDLLVANWGNQNNALYINHGAGNFEKIANEAVVAEPGNFACSGWGDVDNDGDLDLFLTTAYGATASRNHLYKNLLMETGIVIFEKITEGSIVNDMGHSYGFSWGDYDNDGDLDIFVAKTLNEAENNALYRNDGNGNHWLKVYCFGEKSNRSGIGAKVRVKAAIAGKAVWQMRVIEGQNGYCSQNLQAHFGLGDAATIDSIKIEWPSGQVDVLSHVPVDTSLTIRESKITEVQEGRSHAQPDEFELAQNYPNPFNPSTMIRYTLAAPQAVQLTIHDTLGRQVALLVDKHQAAGSHTVIFAAPPELSAGIYLYTIKAGLFRETRKLALLK